MSTVDTRPGNNRRWHHRVAWPGTPVAGSYSRATPVPGTRHSDHSRWTVGREQRIHQLPSASTGPL